jgi:hypothetical protein
LAGDLPRSLNNRSWAGFTSCAKQRTLGLNKPQWLRFAKNDRDIGRPVNGLAFLVDISMQAKNCPANMAYLIPIAIQTCDSPQNTAVLTEFCGDARNISNVDIKKIAAQSIFRGFI